MLSDETKEGMRNAASDDYFAARPHIDSHYNRCMFEAGFDRACRAIEAAVRAELAGQEPVALMYEDVTAAGKPTGVYLLADKSFRTDPDVFPVFRAPVVQPDMVMVPREPTEAMLDAPEVRIDAPCFGCGDTAVTWGQLAEIYRAMVAAAEKEG